MEKKRQRAEVNLEEMVTLGQASAYEALQLYRSRCNRLKVKGELLQAINTAGKGAKALLTHGYETAGAELATVVTSLLVEAGLDITPDIRNMLNEIDAAFSSLSAPMTSQKPTSSINIGTLLSGSAAAATPSTSATTTSRIEFLKAVVNWTMKCGQREYGDPMYHVMLGTALWDHSKANHRKALYHFAVGEAPQTLWKQISDTYSFSAEQAPSNAAPMEDAAAEETTAAAAAHTHREQERLVVLSILHFLALENLRDANIMYRQYTSAATMAAAASGPKSKKGKKKNKQAAAAAGSGDAEGEGASSAVFDDAEMIKFCDYLLQTCNRDAAPLFKQLCQSYSKHISWDQMIPALLTGPIATRLFNIPPSQPNYGGGMPGMPGGGMPGMPPGLNPNMMAMMQNLMRGAGGPGGPGMM